MRNSKPRNAVAVIEEMKRRGSQGVPDQLHEIVDQALVLARGA